MLMRLLILVMHPMTTLSDIDRNMTVFQLLSFPLQEYTRLVPKQRAIKEENVALMRV